MKAFMERSELQSRLTRPAWPFLLWLTVMFFASVGLSFRSLVSAAALALFSTGLWLNETKANRPTRSFIRLTLGSALLLLLLVVEVATWGGDITAGAIMWVGMTALGAIWTIHYERSEPVN